MRYPFVLALTLLATIAPPPAEAVTYYVNASNPSPGNGLSWTTAFDNLQDAFAFGVASDGDQVWVAGGTVANPLIYRPGTAMQSLATFSVPKGVQLYGGFDGVSPVFGNRDPKVFVTILDGDLNESGAPDQGDCFHIVTFLLGAPPENAAPVLDGFVIQNANRTSTPPDPNSGGSGVLIVASSFTATLTIANCDFKNNFVTSGVGVFRGGGIGAFVTSGSLPLTIENCTFSGNEAAQGGGVGLDTGVALTMTDCVFTDNIQNGGTNDGGGAIWLNGSGTILGCVFADNESKLGNGGAIWFGNGTLEIQDCAFVRNSTTDLGAHNGGAIFTLSNLSIDRCIFDFNSTKGSGGAILANAPLFVYNSLFTDNHAVGGGPGQDSGGAIAVGPGNDNVKLVNCTFYRNQAFVRGGAVSAQADIYNCIFWANVVTNGLPGVNNHVHFDPDPIIDFPTAMGNCDMEGDVPPGPWTRPGNIDLDPQFVNQPSGNYRLAQDTSPCIDAGQGDELHLTQLVQTLPHDIFDLDIQMRYIDNPNVTNKGIGVEKYLDMGAYEARDCDALCPGDFDGNGIVDLVDLNIVLFNFGATNVGSCRDGDATGDGQVDLTDLNVVFFNFGTTCGQGATASMLARSVTPLPLPAYLQQLGFTDWKTYKAHVQSLSGSDRALHCAEVLVSYQVWGE